MVSTRVSDLSVEELKVLVRETVTQTLLDLLSDPDQGLELRESMKHAIHRSNKSIREGAALYSADEVAKELGLE